MGSCKTTHEEGHCLAEGIYLLLDHFEACEGGYYGILIPVLSWERHCAGSCVVAGLGLYGGLGV